MSFITFFEYFVASIAILFFVPYIVVGALLLFWVVAEGLLNVGSALMRAVWRSRR